MKHPDVARLMAELYFDEAAARSVLLQIGFPPNMLPPFSTVARSGASWTGSGSARCRSRR